MRGKDFTGLKGGRLTAIERTNRKTASRSWIWKFKCDCGGFTEARIIDVTKGHTQSCGCLQKEAIKNSLTKHGKTETRLYSIWKNMKTRCTNKKNERYKDYGARGITIYPDWMEFKGFYQWAIGSGYKDNLTIERVDNDKGYDPSNCTWVTLQEQQSNRRNTRAYQVGKYKMTAKEISEITGVSISALEYRKKNKKDLITKAQYDEVIASMEAKIKEA